MITHAGLADAGGRLSLLSFGADDLSKPLSLSLCAINGLFRAICFCQIIELVCGSFHQAFKREFFLLGILQLMTKLALFLIHSHKIK